MCAVQVCGTSKVYYTSNLTGPKAHNIIYFNNIHECKKIILLYLKNIINDKIRYNG